MTDTTTQLIQRLNDGEQSNELDVLIEVALFKPHHGWLSAKPNGAGTKVVYVNDEGVEDVCWADEWSKSPDKTIAAFSARNPT